MAKTIKEVFTKECGHLKADNKLAKAIHSFERNFVNNSEDHINFLGGHLLGSPPFRFHASDKNAFFDEILEVDDKILQDEIHSVPSINPDHNVRSDAFNNACVYLLHLFEASSLSARVKTQTQLDIVKIMHYRFLGSLMAHYVKHEPPRDLLEATYAALNYKFALKRHGSWGKLIEARSEDVISSRSIHRRTIQKFDDDEGISRLITDTQGRIREVVKKIIRVFYEVKESNIRITSRSSTIDFDGDLHVRDLTRKNSQLKRYANEVFEERRTLIRKELISVITDAMHTMPERHLIATLEYMSDNYGRRGDPNVQKLIDETMLHAFDFISDNANEFRRHLSLSVLLQRLRSLYMASRSSDQSLIKMREYATKILKKSVKSSNQSMIASVRTGTMLYIVLRAFSMNYYSGGGSMESIVKKVSEASEDVFSDMFI